MAYWGGAEANYLHFEMFGNSNCEAVVINLQNGPCYFGIWVRTHYFHIKNCDTISPSVLEIVCLDGKTSNSPAWALVVALRIQMAVSREVQQNGTTNSSIVEQMV